jgi:hypothetical protein
LYAGMGSLGRSAATEVSASGCELTKDTIVLELRSSVPCCGTPSSPRASHALQGFGA